jgi:hypothetical protein
MNLYWAIEPHAGWEWLADVLAILWVGLGMSCVAWMKMYMQKPTFNTGESSCPFPGHVASARLSERVRLDFRESALVRTEAWHTRGV